jgi:hypothetical protein
MLPYQGKGRTADCHAGGTDCVHNFRSTAEEKEEAVRKSILYTGLDVCMFF